MNKQLMIKIALFVCLISFSVEKIEAKLSQPDYVLYGTATWFGGPLAVESEISLYLENQLLTVTKYSMGTVDALNGLYALRVPMDSLDPRSYGKARPGDPATIFINGKKVAEIIIGEYGVAERLDIDPSNLAGDQSVVNIMDGQIKEGDSGQTDVMLTLTLSKASTELVTVDWTTLEQTVANAAQGGEACDFDVDFIHSNGTVEFAIGATTTFVSVPICGDSIIEPSETFEVFINNSQNAMTQFDRAIATILDDDGQPQLRGFDQVIFEPESGMITQSFNVKLSRAYEQNVTVNYMTQAVSATPGSDFIPVSGMLTIPAGDQEAFINIDVLADNDDEGIEVFRLVLSEPVNATLVNNPMTAFIMDANRDEQTKPDQDRGVNNQDVPALTSPTDVVFAPNAHDVYVGTLFQGGHIVHLGFDNGRLPLKQVINNQLVGFESALLNKIRDVKMAADGTTLYVAASGDHAINVFSRDTQTGQLSLLQVIENGSPDDMGLGEVYAMALSPGGAHLYAVGSLSDSVAVFAVDALDGQLSYVEHETNSVNDPSDVGPPVVFMDRPIDIKVAADGSAVYVAADYSSALVVFERDGTDGSLNFKESFKSGVNGVQNLGGAAALWATNDNENVYVVGRADNTVARFTVSASGQLSYADAVTQVDADFIGLDAPTAIMGNGDNSRIYALGFDDSSMVSFNRDVIDGHLIFADIEQDNIKDVTDLAGPIGMDLSADNQWILVAAAIDNAIMVFRTHLNDLIFDDGFEEQP
ncbi:Calx-beta domain-containing protein [Marinicella gelatinilytica]|uniref:Calx-beta domain-containing protein n=1 Tax=Marinicella gelatinilytica TaxID=2996017 RepID=UPI002260FB00|nr:beta-propeller fold lactonase family protein [Marinicella gelatinilytica]MCX7543749.1 beta-propeller fold lactonase family protein [Marinicella gelatinilytica]